MKRIALGLMLFLGCQSVYATDVLISLGSFHAGKPDNSTLNERNPGIGLANDKWMAGTYLNSYKGQTYYFGRRFELPHGFDMEFGLSSYGNFKWEGKSKILPIGQFTYDVGYARIGLVPAFNATYKGIFTLQLKIPIK